MFALTLIDNLPTLAIFILKLCTHVVDILMISLLLGSLPFKLALAKSLLARGFLLSLFNTIFTSLLWQILLT